MKASQNKNQFKNILDELASVIPVYRQEIFKTILLGLVIGKGRKGISGIYRIFESILSSIISRKRFYCFLGSGKIPWNKLLEKIIALMGNRFLTNGKLLLAVDDTSYGKTGRKIENCDIHFDHAAKKNSAKYIYGHCRVVVGVLLFIHGRWACLPLAQQVYRLVKNVVPREFLTKIDIAAKLIVKILSHTDADVLVCCDSWFGNKSLIEHELIKTNINENRLHILSRLRKNCCLFEIPGSAPKGKRGRKRKYGKSMGTLQEIGAKAERKKGRFFIYGKYRECEYAEFVCMNKRLQRKIKVVLVFKRGYIFPIFCTDLSLTAKQMIEYYSARWKIESGFKELKHELGALDNQARKKDAVENHFNMTCLAMSITWVYALELEQAPDRYHPKPHSCSFSFSDIRQKIKNEYIEPVNFNGVCGKTVKLAQNLILKYFYQQVS